MRTNWFHIEGKDFNELGRLGLKYHREAQRCKGSKAYIAGCVMAGACLESFLLTMVNIYGKEIQAAGFVPTVKGKPKPLLKWTLSELIHVAREMKWLPSGLQIGTKWNTRRAKIGDYTEALRQTRNLVHPSRHLQDLSPSRVTKKYLEGSIEILEAAIKHLRVKIEESLRKDMGIAD
jgi:hypothetical protein